MVLGLAFAPDSFALSPALAQVTVHDHVADPAKIAKNGLLGLMRSVESASGQTAKNQKNL